MNEIEVKTEGAAYHVTVRDGGSETRHRVQLPEPFYRKLTGGGRSKEDCIKAAFLFLLEREPKEAILSQFELPLIGHYFPEFEQKFPQYLKQLA